jgi:hypothetical protein
MRIRRVLPLLALLAACSDTSGPSARDVRISTTVNRAAPQSEPNVTVVVENRGSRPLVVPPCGDRIALGVDRYRNGRWENFSSNTCPFDLVSDPVELAPGESASSPLSLREPGRYRVQLNAYHRDDPDPSRMVVSEAFEIQ